METSRCPLHAGCPHGAVGRRRFIVRSAGATIAPLVLGRFGSLFAAEAEGIRRIRACGPASKYVPKVKAAFVRRRGEYGMRWPGQVYDGEAARKKYAAAMVKQAKALGILFDLRSAPIYSSKEAGQWLEEAKAAGVDGLMVVVLDRQEHAWPTAYQAVGSGIPTVIYSPLGTSFTTNTSRLAGAPGCVVHATDDFSHALFGMKMLQAGARMRRTRCVVLRGNKRSEWPLGDTGITLRHVPAGTFLEYYREMSETAEVRALAERYLKGARKRTDASEQDVRNGVKSYFVAARILEEEQGDAITMDCLGALGKSEVSLPCIAWSRMNDDAIPAACEADPGAVAAHVVVQYLFDRPGFQQDPVPETAVGGIIGAHCSCPTKLNGFDEPPERFDLKHHHGNRDAVPRTIWREGQRITCLDVLPGGAGKGKKERSRFLISTGTVLENLEVPPAGGCVVSVLVKMDGDREVLSFPGFHQLFFYGEFARELKDFCQLQGFEAEMV